MHTPSKLLPFLILTPPIKLELDVAYKLAPLKEGAITVPENTGEADTAYPKDLTNAVVATLQELSALTTVGAQTVPVKVGEARVA